MSNNAVHRAPAMSALALPPQQQAQVQITEARRVLALQLAIQFMAARDASPDNVCETALRFESHLRGEPPLAIAHPPMPDPVGGARYDNGMDLGIARWHAPTIDPSIDIV